MKHNGLMIPHTASAQLDGVQELKSTHLPSADLLYCHTKYIVCSSYAYSPCKNRDSTSYMPNARNASSLLIAADAKKSSLKIIRLRGTSRLAALLLCAIVVLSLLTACGSTNRPSDTVTTDSTPSGYTAPISTSTAPVSTVVSPDEWQRFETSFVGPFDTVTQLILFAENEVAFERYCDQAKEELWRYHEWFTIYDDPTTGENLKTVNDRAGTPVTCPSEILDLIELGIQDYHRSNGRVNIAMGAVLSLWHDTRVSANAAETEQEKKNVRLPSDAALHKAVKHTDIEDVVVDREAGTILLRNPAMSIDVGAIAKGYAAEQVALHLKESGLTSAILNVGGNVRTIGGNIATGQPWKVGIRDPKDLSGQSILGVVASTDLSVVTSGHYERFFTLEGRTYSHIIDPDTLYPADYCESVSILAQDSATADLLSTVLMLLTIEEGKSLLENFPGCDALWVDGDEITMTEGFRAVYQEKN